MIQYSLTCAQGHDFDSWFQSATAYDALAEAGHLACAICGSAEVQKSVMAPRVSGTRSEERALSTPRGPAEQALAAWRAHVEKTSDYVGRDFVQEARAMHLGEAPERSIWGEARPDEARRLIEDGVPVAPLPFRPQRKSN
ncbi:DUF1178 family protein [Roseivivax isoporae]|uniref:DUF1178 domain-containing protein n=1 Tax=Roseivivax isoporae LMG 25204 TaxID=1449351 RepID=X7F504_9RHOB|nr:DUF1178 family protein [Roseivivax isoporae]ETX27139.1 hypothetical protein RISW2_16520 [Roseivivax isoporae LMG 25204]